MMFETLKNNPYPGRGILLGRAASGWLATAYFITGRSPSSQNRVLFEEGGMLKTRPFFADGPQGNELTIYTALCATGGQIIVANGSHMEAIRQALQAGSTHWEALKGCTFEPDAPHFTPRISGVMELGSASCELAILKRDGKSGACIKNLFAFECAPGQGRLIHTYQGEGEPLPSFLGEPRPVCIPADIAGFANGLWASLDPKTRVALYASFTEPQTGRCETQIINRHTCPEE